MAAEGLLRRDGRIVASGCGWRSHAGVSRAVLVSVPIGFYVHPMDARALGVAMEAAGWARQRLIIRMGRWGAWHTVRITIGQRDGDYSCISVERLGGPAPRGGWWSDSLEGASAMPPLSFS